MALFMAALLGTRTGLARSCEQQQLALYLARPFRAVAYVLGKSGS